MTRSALRPAGLALLCAGLLAGCGQTGALYLPDAAPEQVAPRLPAGPATTGPGEPSDRDAARPRRAP